MKSYLVEKQIDLDNCTIFYLEGGTPSTSAPILFLHGWAVSLEPYQESLNILADRYHVIAPYLPGLSKSTAPNFVVDYTEYAEVIVDFITALKLEKAHIIGHSLGGGIAIALAALKPSLVRSSIIADSTGIPLVGSLPEVLLRRAIEMPAQMGQMKLQPVMAIVQCLLYNSLFHFQKVVQTAMVAISKDIRSLLPRVSSPCLILWGENDLLTPLANGREIARGIKGSKLVIVEGVYHEWSLFFPEKFTAIICEFIDGIETALPALVEF